MLKKLALALCFLGTPLAARAQDELIKDFTAADLEKFIKKDLNKDFQLDAKRGYDIKDTPHYIALSDKKVVLVYSVVRRANLAKAVNADSLNEWNRTAYYTRIYLYTDKDEGEFLRFEATVDASAGITRNQLKAFYANYERELDKNVKAIFGGFKKADKKDARYGGRDAKPEAVRQAFPQTEQLSARPKSLSLTSLWRYSPGSP
jgi:hypothetical protein